MANAPGGRGKMVFCELLDVFRQAFGPGTALIQLPFDGESCDGSGFSGHAMQRLQYFVRNGPVTQYIDHEFGQQVPQRAAAGRLFGRSRQQAQCGGRFTQLHQGLGQNQARAIAQLGALIK